jgi:hypothetical protein
MEKIASLMAHQKQQRLKFRSGERLTAMVQAADQPCIAKLRRHVLWPLGNQEMPASTHFGRIGRTPMGGTKVKDALMLLIYSCARACGKRMTNTLAVTGKIHAP